MPNTAAETRHGNEKVSQEDWLDAARHTLITKGVADVKILTLAHDLGVSRSSFYWNFKSRRDLLSALLTSWEDHNSKHLIEQCGQPADNINHAVCQFFVCFLDTTRFDRGLELAVRAWSRGDAKVRRKVDAADNMRLEAICEMFLRHGFAPAEADARARILYYMQLGYHALDVQEPPEARVARTGAYLKGFTGQEASPDLIADFSRRSLELMRRD